MLVRLYGKKDCGICDSAKEKLERLGVDYEVHDLAYHTTGHEGWKDDGSVDVLAAFAEFNTLPLLRVNGSVLPYAPAMKKLKMMLKGTKHDNDNKRLSLPQSFPVCANAG